MKSTAYSTVIILLIGSLSGCVDAPVNFETDNSFPDLSQTIFPLVEGSYWSYETFGGGFPVENPYYLGGTTIPIPLEIDRAEQRYYYLDRKEVDRVRNYGPAPVWLVPERSFFLDELGYLANDTMVVAAREFGSRYDGKGMLVENEERYMPLSPVLGVSYRGLDGTTYTGTEVVTTPAYIGEAHIFEDGEQRFAFAEGVGLVLYSVRAPGFPVWIDQLTLTDYRIGP